MWVTTACFVCCNFWIRRLYLLMFLVSISVIIRSPHSTVSLISVLCSASVFFVSALPSKWMCPLRSSQNVLDCLRYSTQMVNVPILFHLLFSAHHSHNLANFLLDSFGASSSTLRFHPLGALIVSLVPQATQVGAPLRVDSESSLARRLHLSTEALVDLSPRHQTCPRLQLELQLSCPSEPVLSRRGMTGTTVLHATLSICMHLLSGLTSIAPTDSLLWSMSWSRDQLVFQLS